MGMFLTGIYFLTPEMNFENSYTKGVLMGIISGVFYSLRNILTKKNISHFNASKVMFYQMIEKLLEKGVNTFIEIGPKKSLSSFVKKIDRLATILNIEDSVESVFNYIIKLIKMDKLGMG